MELRHLRYFVAVAESLHFGEAAAKLRIAQPSLSQQISALENDLQTGLLRRTRRRVELTDAGRVFLEEARDILARADRAAIMARRAGRTGAGHLRVGVGYCMDHMALVKAVGVFSAANPNVRVELRTMSVQLQVAALRDQRLDVAFVRRTEGEPWLLTERLVTEPLALALPRKHRLASRKSVQLSSVADEPFVLTSRELVPVYHDIVLNACRDAGFLPNASQEADQLHVLMQFVGSGCGVALVPAFSRRTRPSRVAVVALRPAVPVLDTVVAWRRETEAAAVTDFIAVARRAFGLMARRAALAFEDSQQTSGAH
jgi:DNA-binding transcriptional LysR family regulator